MEILNERPTVGSCYECNQEKLAWPPNVRVVALLVRKEAIWLIGLPDDLSSDDRSGRHTKAPFRVELSVFLAHLKEKALLQVECKLQSRWKLSDEKLAGNLRRAADPGKIKIGKNGRKLKQLGVSPTLEARDERWKLISTFVKGKSMGDLLENNRLAKWISEQGLFKKRRLVYDAFHRYLAGKQHKNSLLPSYARCGALGTFRQQKNKIGRPNALVRKDPSAPKGKLITLDDHEKIAFGYGAFVCKNSTLQSAYDSTMGAFYALSRTKENGETRVA